MKKRWIIVFLFLAAMVCLAYGISIFVYAGFSSKFHLIWFVISAVLFALGVCCRRVQMGKMVISHRILVALGSVVAVCALVFIVVEVLLIASAFAKPTAGVDVMVVLGCQVRGTKVSKALRYRLEAATEYLCDNPDTVVIVSGGQGTGEDISEAEAMQRYLLANGIAQARIIKEERSTSTVENIRYSREIMESLGYKLDSVVVVSNGFHIFRAVHICKRQGLDKVQGLAGSSDVRMAPAYYLREFFAVIKDLIKGNLAW
jgi:uncharacterized SAM-binding protein YcdF (DUF218 family)